MSYIFSRILPVAAVLAFSAVSVAAPLTGTLDITGSATVSYTELDFGCIPGQPGCVEGTEGNQFAVGAQSGDFTAVAFQFGEILDLNSTDQPIGTPFVLNNFISFAGMPWNIQLTSISSGDAGVADCFAAPSAGQTCTPPGSAFTLLNQLDDNGNFSSTATFQVSGLAWTGSQATGFSTFTGTFSADRNSSFQDLLTTLGANGNTGSITAPYSATFEFTPIPEPGTTSLMIAGGALLAVGSLRRRKQNQ